MRSKVYAEVVVDITAKKLDKIFHYRVPPALRQRLAEGMRVVVPFGPRTVEGYVLGFCDKADVPGTKDIINILEEETLLTSDLLAVAGWMSEKYLCSRVDAIKAMLPVKARGRYKYIMAEEVSDLFREENINLLNINELKVYNYIIKQGIIPSDELRNKFGSAEIAKVVKKLTRMGIVKTVGQIKAEIRPRIRQVAVLAERGETPEQLMANLTRAPRQASAIKAVLENGRLPVRELINKAGITYAVIKELVKKEYLVIETEEVRRDPCSNNSFAATKPAIPTRDQSRVLREINAAIDEGKFRTFLLHGVTGSGKTEVYLQAIAHCLKNGRQAIVMVPEISLTPQMIERFKGRFGDLVAVLHSRLSAGERFDEWRLIKTGRVKIVVGARSAVFAPFSDPGLIIIDEEHETSYKQEDNPKYHAREAAIARARFLNSLVILGSATPSLESYTRAVARKYRLLSLSNRIGGQPLPPVEVVDLREEMNSGNRSIFSHKLIEKLETVLTAKKQAILFLNRRGHSTFVICRECGLVMKCPKCSITLTLHAGENVLRCHYCDFQVKAPDLCPKCAGKSIRYFGIGTQKVEEEARKCFPHARVTRMDMDTTTKKGSHERILSQFKEGKIDILVGTQMIAKGLDFPNVTLVGVITADTALNLPDFRAAERTFQLLTQVAGRAGRGAYLGEVIVQTYNPEHYSIKNAQEHDFIGFYQEEMKIREVLGYPPYCSLVRILIFGMEENSVIRGAEALASRLRIEVSQHVLGTDQPLLGPAPAPVSKLRNRFRWQICIKGKPGKLIRQIIKESISNLEDNGVFTNIGISVDIDPMGMI